MSDRLRTIFAADVGATDQAINPFLCEFRMVDDGTWDAAYQWAIAFATLQDARMDIPSPRALRADLQAEHYPDIIDAAESIVRCWDITLETLPTATMVLYRLAMARNDAGVYRSEYEDSYGPGPLPSLPAYRS